MLTTRADLQRRVANTTCEDCGDGARLILLEPPCHDASCFAEYVDCELTLVCGECGNPYLTVPVAG
jgi:hypothetical protein